MLGRAPVRNRMSCRSMTRVPLNQYCITPSAWPTPPVIELICKYASTWFQLLLYPEPELGWNATWGGCSSLSLYHGGMLKQVATTFASTTPLHPSVERSSVRPIRLMGGMPKDVLIALLSCSASRGMPPF